jgi:hypothetical protein
MSLNPPSVYILKTMAFRVAKMTLTLTKKRSISLNPFFSQMVGFLSRRLLSCSWKFYSLAVEYHLVAWSVKFRNNMKSDLHFTKFGRNWKEYKIGETLRLLDHWKPRCIPVTGHSYNWNKKEDAKTSPANCMVTQRRGIAQLHEIR